MLDSELNGDPKCSIYPISENGKSYEKEIQFIYEQSTHDNSIPTDFHFEKLFDIVLDASLSSSGANGQINQMLQYLNEFLIVIDISKYYEKRNNYHKSKAPRATKRKTKMTTVQPLQIEPILMREFSSQIAPFAFRIGLPTNLTRTLRGYINKMGITDLFARYLLQTSLNNSNNITSKSIEAGNYQNVLLNDQLWYAQRPDVHWNSNMHWISPKCHDAQNEYLDTLAEGGFDDVLDTMGKYFNLDGIVCYHLTFIGVSHCEDGYIHYDFLNTGGKSFNLIIPLILVNGSSPELEIHVDAKSLIAGDISYEHDVGVIIGDLTYHRTASCDYRQEQKMRIAATIYMTDISTDNVNAVLKSYTQAYPTKNRTHLLHIAGQHWNSSNSNNKRKTKLPRITDPSKKAQERYDPPLIKEVGGSHQKSNI